MVEIWSEKTCWRTERADRAAWLVDSQAYFSAAYDALLKAQKSIFLLGWGFDPRTRLAPDSGADAIEHDEIGRILLRLAKERPQLDVRLLVWKSALPISATQDFFPHRARRWFENTNIRFHLDNVAPIGACHHQKLLVIDDALAFVGGGDFATDRWDSVAHRDEDRRRAHLDQTCHSPRHEMTVMVDGLAARALGDLSRARWARGTGQTDTTELFGAPAGDVWPDYVRPDLTDVDVHIGRTEPGWRDYPAVDEIRHLTLASIYSAKSLIYLENQYFTSPQIAEALASRLAEPKGPEVVLISTRHAPSWFDRLTMDRVRDVMIRRLREADIYGRFRAYSPVTPGGRPIIVHSKTTIVDDRIVRVGSANLNNRSMGFDTELELAFEAKNEDQREAIANLRNGLAGHFLARSAQAVERAAGDGKSLIRAIESLNRHGRLAPLVDVKLGPIFRFIADFHLGDPTAAEDSFRLLKRRRVVDEQVREIAAEGGMRRFIEAVQNPPPAAGDPTPDE